jgi:hypothetical protein
MRVDLLLADRRWYTYEAYAARHACYQLACLKIPHQCVYLYDGSLTDYLLYVQDSPPNWTLSFVNLLPHCTPLCDMMRVPHFFWLEASFAQAVHYLNSTYGKVGINCASAYDKISAPNVYFLPFGIEETKPEKAIFDLVFFADLLALAFLEKTWQELFSADEVAAIRTQIEKNDPFGCLSHYFYIEQYLNAQKTYRAVSSFKEVKLDIFGEHAGTNWLVQLPAHIHLHTQLPFTEHFEVLRTSKMILAEPGSLWYGPAIASGCLPVSADEKEVNYYLTYPEERKKRLSILQETLRGRSWEKQVGRLVEIMQPL